MGWGDLASNQMVSFTDAQTSGFSLKSGQSHVTSNQCMTSSDITTKYNVVINGSYASNRLVPKSAWTGTSYSFSFGPAYSTGIAACVFNEPGVRTRYTSTPYLTVGTVVYTDSALTLPLNGGGSWFQPAVTNENLGYTYQINSSGQITALYDCMY